MREFLKFARKTYGVTKFYLPTYDTRVDAYHSNPPMNLYKELPHVFGFKTAGSEKLPDILKRDGWQFQLLERYKSKFS